MKFTLSITAFVIAVAWTLSACQPQAMGLDIYSDEYDGMIEFRTDAGVWPAVHPSFDGSGNEGEWGNVGEWFTTGLTSTVIQFEVPDFGSVVDPFLTANLGVHLAVMGTGPTTTPVDLYAVRTSSSRDLLPSDYYSGTAVDSNADALIQTSFLDPNSNVEPNIAAANNFTDAGGDAALLSYLNTAYAGGTGAGDFVFLRLSYHSDTFATVWDGYQLRLRNDPDQGSWPVLSFTTNNLPGDVDNDGNIDLNDFEIIRNNWLETNESFGSTLARFDGDLDLDGEVGLPDFREWKDVFPGSPLQVAEAFASLSQVPEPGSIALTLVAGLGLMARRRKR